MPILLHTQNIFGTSAVSVSGATLDEAPVTRLYDRSIDLLWTSWFLGDFVAKADQGTNPAEWRAVQFGYIAKHTFSGYTVNFQYSANNITWIDAALPVTAGEDDIIFILPTPITQRYWRFYIVDISNNPAATEIFIGNTVCVPVQRNIACKDETSITWHRTFAGGERATKYGPSRRRRSYTMLLRGDDRVNFLSAMSDLNDYQYSFFITDHRGDTFFCRVQEPPSISDEDVTRSVTKLDIIEVL